MHKDIRAEYENKKMTAEEIAVQVHSGDRVYVGDCTSFAYELLEALWQRRKELEDITILCSNSTEWSHFYYEKPEKDSPFRIESFFLGRGERTALRNGMPADFISVHLSQVDLWCRVTAKPDICFFEVSGPDENGFLSFPEGTAVTTSRADVQYIATEYGCINLKERNMKDRIRGLISLAHPDFRDQLTEEAKERRIL